MLCIFCGFYFSSSCYLPSENETTNHDHRHHSCKTNHGEHNFSIGEGRFIHTYMHDGNPLPSFQGEPKLVEIPDDMDAFTDMLWNSLNEDNKVSLFVRFIDIETGKYETKIVNKNM